MVDGGVVGHRLQGGLDILGGELAVEMLSPQLLHLHPLHAEPPEDDSVQKVLPTRAAFAP